MGNNNTLGTVSLHEAQGPITDLLEKLGGGNGQEWLCSIGKFLRKENPWGLVVQTRSVLVNYDQSLEKAVQAGNYDGINETSEFLDTAYLSTRSGSETVLLLLTKLRHSMPLDETLAELDYHGLQPANVEQLLAVGAHKYFLGRSLIMALGSIFPITELHSQAVPAIWTQGIERRIMCCELGRKDLVDGYILAAPK